MTTNNNVTFKHSRTDNPFSMNDLVNPDDREYTQHAYQVEGTFGLVGVVFADCAQDALDTLADEGHLKAYEVSPMEEEQWTGEEVDYLGNYGSPHDVTELHITRLT